MVSLGLDLGATLREADLFDSGLANCGDTCAAAAISPVAGSTGSGAVAVTVCCEAASVGEDKG